MENRTDTTPKGVSTLKEVGGIHLISKQKNCQMSEFNYQGAGVSCEGRLLGLWASLRAEQDAAERGSLLRHKANCCLCSPYM